MGMDILERMLGIYVTSLYKEGLRFIELRSLIAALQVVKGARKMAIVYYLSVVASMIMVAGIFVLVSHGLYQYEQLGYFMFDYIYGLGWSFLVLGLLATVWALREKRWLKAFGLQSQLQEVVRPKEKTSPASATAGESFSSDELKSLVDNLIQVRLDAYIKEMQRPSQQQKSEPEPTPETSERLRSVSP